MFFIWIFTGARNVKFFPERYFGVCWFVFHAVERQLKIRGACCLHKNVKPCLALLAVFSQRDTTLRNLMSQSRSSLWLQRLDATVLVTSRSCCLRKRWRRHAVSCSSIVLLTSKNKTFETRDCNINNHFGCSTLMQLIVFQSSLCCLRKIWRRFVFPCYSSIPLTSESCTDTDDPNFSLYRNCINTDYVNFSQFKNCATQPEAKISITILTLVPWCN